MKRINMTKYGFIRNERTDFHDDGSNFQGYLTAPNSRLRVSKHVSDGQVYLSCDMNGCKLDYEEYSKLPNYKKSGWDYNGVSVESLTEQDMIDWYNACVAYEKEYIEAESKVVFPTIEEIRNQCIRINNLRQAEINHVNELLKEHAVDFLIKAESYDIKWFKDYYKSLTSKHFDIDTYPQSIQQSNYGRNFIKDTNSDLKPCWYYEHLVSMINKYTGGK